MPVWKNAGRANGGSRETSCACRAKNMLMMLAAIHGLSGSDRSQKLEQNIHVLGHGLAVSTAGCAYYSD